MTDPSINAATYAENVRREMRDLPADAVADLTDGLEADIAASLADGAVLPPPGEYAHDLMRAAGIETKVVGSVLARVERTLRPARAWLHDHFGDLAPAWWVIRGWVLVQFLGWLFIDVDSKYLLVSQWGEATPLGVVLIVMAIVASVWHARRAVGSLRTVGRVLSAVLVVPFIGLVLADSHVAPENSWNGSMTPAATYPPGQCAATPAFVGYTVEDILKSDVGLSLVNQVTNIVWQMVGGEENVNVTEAASSGALRVVAQSPVQGTIICGTPVHLYLGYPGADTTTTIEARRTPTSLPPLPKVTTTSTP